MSEKLSDPSIEQLTIRPFENNDEVLASVELQKEIWGQDFQLRVAPTILIATPKIGGVVAGAFNPAGELEGFIFGMTGYREGKPVHWSDMLAVREPRRNLGLGTRLKLYQRDQVIRLGVDDIFWTFDPLEALNAHFNMNRLGVRIDRYVKDFYPEDDRSDLHRGLGMDRFIVRWHTGDPLPDHDTGGRVPAPEEEKQIPVLNTGEQGELLDKPCKPESPVVRVEIPVSIQQMRDTSIEQARRWRENTCSTLLDCQERGYRVTRFYRHSDTQRCFYILEQTP